MTIAVKRQKPKQSFPHKKLNLEEYENKIKAERNIIAGIKKQISEVMDKVSEIQASQMKVSNKRTELRKEVDSLTQEIQMLEKQSNEIYSKIRELQESNVNANTKLKTLGENLAYKDHAKLELAIKNLESVLINQKYDRASENRIISQLKTLKRQKPLIDQYQDMKVSAKLKKESSLEPLHVQNAEIRNEIQKLQDKKKGLQQKMNQMNEDKSVKIKIVQELLEKRNQLKKEIAAHKQQEMEIVSVMNSLKREHEAVIAKQQKELNKKRQEDRKRKEIMVIRESLEMELEQIERNLMDSETRLAEQLITYVKSLMNAQTDQKTFSQTTVQAPEKAKLDGFYYKKDDKNPYLNVQLDDCLPGGSMKSKKEDRKNRKNNVVGKPNQPFAHGILMLADFSKLEINPPFTIDDCATCINALEQKLIDVKSCEESNRTLLEKQKAEILSKLESLKIE